MNRIKKWIKCFIKKYIVDEDPYVETEEQIFQERKKQFEEWQKPSPTKKEKR